MNLRFLRVNHHWQEPAVSGSIKREEIQRVGGTAEHTLPQPVFGLGFIGRAVGFLLAADKGADLLDALGVTGGQHLRHLDDPVALQLGKHLVIIQLFQIIGEPLILYSQEAKEGRLSGSLAARQTEQFLILGTWMEHPADGSQQEVLEHFFHIVVLVCPQKVMQAGAYPGYAVPPQTVQHILNGVIAVFVCHDGESCHQLLFTGQAILLLKVKEQIFDIGISQGAGVSTPAQISHNINTVGQQIQPDCAPQKRILAKHCAAISNGIGRLSFFRRGKAFPHFSNGQFLTFGLPSDRH